MRQLSLAVVGAQYENKSGPTRMFEISMCEPGEMVELRPEPKNKHDPQAIAVYSARSIQIGYIRAERCQLIHTAMRRLGVSAIFQHADRWGCTIRAHLDGTAPVLPDLDDSRAADPVSFGREDDCWWPDEEWPD